MVKIHIVQKGDTIAKLAERFHVDVKAIINSNPQIASPDMIMPGMKLKIPGNAKQVKTSPVKKTQEVKQNTAESVEKAPMQPVNPVESETPDSIAEPAERPMDPVETELPTRYARPHERPFKEMPLDDTEKHQARHSGDFFRVQTPIQEKTMKDSDKPPQEPNQQTCCILCNRPMQVERPVYYPFPWTQVKPNFFAPPNMPNQFHSKAKKPNQEKDTSQKVYNKEHR